MECKLLDMMSYGNGGASANIAICEVIKIHVAEDIFAAGLIHPNKIDLVARMSGDFYCRAFGEAIFEVEKPKTKIGIGYDQIPDCIKRSQAYSANNLGKFGNIELIPSVESIILYIKEVKAITAIDFEVSLSAFYRYKRDKNFVYMFKFLLLESELNAKTKKNLFEETAKVALESNQTEIAWKIALLAGSE
jgi:hypothetical protein